MQEQPCEWAECSSVFIGIGVRLDIDTGYIYYCMMITENRELYDML